MLESIITSVDNAISGCSIELLHVPHEQNYSMQCYNYLKEKRGHFSQQTL